MNQGGWILAHGCGYAPYYGTFVYQPNGASNPDPTLFSGTLKRFVTSVTYSATGVQTIVFTPDFVFPKPVVWFTSTSFDVLANAFGTSVLLWTPATRTLVLQQHQGTTGIAAASNPAASVKLLAHTNNSSGA